MGLSVAAGIGKAARIDELDRRAYCIIGDGESREGQIAEALDFIIDHNLSNVLPIFNCNEYGQAGRVSGQQSPEKIAGKLKAYGFDVATIDGHDPEQIRDAHDRFAALTADGTPDGRRRQDRQGLGLADAARRRVARQAPEGEALERALQRTRRAPASSSPPRWAARTQFTIQPPTEAPPSAGDPRRLPLQRLHAPARHGGRLHSGRLATRKAYGMALRALGDRTRTWSCSTPT